MKAHYIVGDVFAALNSFTDDEKVDLVLTSPPFLALRTYLPDDHPQKSKEIGTEPTPGEYIDSLLEVVEACSQVLKPEGSMCFELGDTYAGSGGHGGDYAEGGWREGQPKFEGSARQARTRRIPENRTRRANGCATHNRPVQTTQLTGGDGWPLDKSLCLIPELFRVALVYGFNPLTGRETPRWRARNVIRWCRPNPPVGALSDKVRPATSDMVVICRDRDRYFDLDSIRSPHKDPDAPRRAHPRSSSRTSFPGGGGDIDAASGTREYNGHRGNDAGAPPLDHWWHDEDSFDQDAWLIPTRPYPGAHYATWPEALCVKPILSMCPPGGVVLDPFAGSGTTLAVATGHGRDSIGIDIDARNADLALQSVGPLILTVEHLAAVVMT